MKGTLYRTTVIVLCAAAMLSLLVAVSFGEEKRRPVSLNLIDAERRYPVLGDLYSDGFFNFSGITARYVANGERKAPAEDSITLRGSMKKVGSDSYSSFSIFLLDPMRRNVRMSWDVPADDEYMRDRSLRAMIPFSDRVGRSGVPAALVDADGFAKDVRDIKVRYDDGAQTGVAGYDLVMSSGFSSMHRFNRTLIEMMFLNGIGVANYWINKDANMEDWRYKFSRSDVRSRFMDGWKYDTNAFRTNTLYHIYSGAIYYQTARSNDYGIIASTVWTFVGSFIWEYLGEWREQTSANDMIFTPFPGALAGEALRQTSIYIERCLPHSVYGTIASFLFDPMRFFNRWIDRGMDGTYRVNLVIMHPAQGFIESRLEDRFRR